MSMLSDVVRYYYHRLVLNDARRFDQSGIVVFHGDRRSGKTARAAQLLHTARLRYPGLVILSNIYHVDIDHQYRSWNELFELLPDDDKDPRYPNGILILFDEAQLSLEANDFRDFPGSFLEVICQLGHIDTQLIVTTQEYDRLVKQIREQADVIADTEVIVPTRVARIRWFRRRVWVKRQTTSDPKKLRQLAPYKTETFHISDEIYMLYHTKEFVRSFKKTVKDGLKQRVWELEP